MFESTVNILIHNFSRYLTKKDIKNLTEDITDLKEELSKLSHRICSIHELHDLEEFDKVYFIFHAFVTVKNFPYIVIPTFEKVVKKLNIKPTGTPLNEIHVDNSPEKLKTIVAIQYFYNVVKQFNIYQENPLTMAEFDYYQKIINTANDLLLELRFWSDLLANNPKENLYALANILEIYKKLDCIFFSMDQLFRRSMGFIKKRKI